MPQEFHVLRCFSCDTFQVHIVKKAKKWECKMCGAKQSFKQNYGKGTAKDCRAHVMKLNELRYMKANTENEISDELPSEALISESNELETIEKKTVVSKWAKYLEEPEKSEEEEEEEVDYLDEIIQKKRKQNSRKSGEKRKKISNENDDIKKSFEGEGFQAVKNSYMSTKENKYSRFLDEEETDSINEGQKNVSKFSKMTDSDLSFLDNELDF